MLCDSIVGLGTMGFDGSSTVMQEAQKPAGQRRPAPSIPPELVGELPKTAKDIQAFNDIMFQEYNTHSLDPCPTCGRTFRPEALAKHMGSCSGLPRRRSQPS